MAKVVTSAGLNEFVSSGKVETIESTTPKGVKTGGEAPPLEVKEAKPAAEAAPVAEVAPPEEQHVDDDPETQAEIEKSERFRKTINKKHRAMKEAQESAAEAERFAENQFNEARRERDRAAQLERELADLRAKAAPPVPEAKKPDPNDARYKAPDGQFKAFEYAEDTAAYAAKQAVAEFQKKQVEEAQKAEAARAEAAAKARVAEFAKGHPDYAEVMSGADVQTHSAVLQYMAGSEHIAEIAYYLAKNPDYVERINKQNPLKAIAEIGKLELTFEKPKPEPKAETPPPPAPKASGAPAPITPLNAGPAAIVQVDPAKMSFRELRAYERAKSKRH
jgi:hypothetical protein